MVRLIGITIALALLTLGCGGGSSPKASGAKTISASLKEWEIVANPEVGAAGPVTFNLLNRGAETHEFVVVKTDLDPAKLPTAKDGSVSEEGKGITAVDEVEDIEKGKTAKLKVTLDAGKYVLFCNRVENGDVHYKFGMHTAFTVE